MPSWTSLLAVAALAVLAAGSPRRPSPSGTDAAAASLRTLRRLLPGGAVGEVQSESEATPRQRRPPGMPAGMDSVLPPPRYRHRGPAKHPVRAANASRVADDEDPYRLPNTVLPFSYSLFLAVDVDGFAYMGSVDIYVNVLADTDTVVLHAAQNVKLDKRQVRVEQYKPPHGEAAAEFRIKALQRNNRYQTVTLTLDRPLREGRHYVVTFAKFESELQERLSGFYRSSYEQGGKTRWLATTQFEPTHAREAFPCFDEPSFKARFDIDIGSARRFTARSNMPGSVIFDDDQVGLLSESPIAADPDGAVVTRFETTVPMSTYLLAWVVSDFEEQANEAGNFSTWARKDIVAGAGLSQEVGQKALAELGTYLAIPYVLPKTDQFAIPDFSAGAMENWGLVTYREEYLIQTERTDVRYEQQIQAVICHELGHQWSGNLVTMDWWSHTWLNEGFATFFENFICDKVNPGLHLVDKAVMAYANDAMVLDAFEDVHAMSSPVSSYEEIESKFDGISYSKGGTVLRMFQHMLTPSVFQTGLQLYFSANMYKNARPDHLFHALSSAVAAHKEVLLPTDLAVVAASWTEQAGVPLVRVARDYAGKATLTQEHFKVRTATASSPLGKDNKWYIPVAAVSSAALPADWENATTPTAWLTPDTGSVTIDVAETAHDKGWLLVNPLQTGYYRVQYDEENLEVLLEALVAPRDAASIPAASRAQLMSDALALALAGRYDWVTPIAFLESLRAETEASVWSAAGTAIAALTDYLVNTDVFPAFEAVIREYTGQPFRAVGLRVGADDSHATRHLRYYAARYACEAELPECLSEAGALLSAWLDSPDTVRLHPDTIGPTLCYGVKASDADTFGKMRALWEAATGDIKEWLGDALVCSDDSQLLEGLLEDQLDAAAKDGDAARSLRLLLQALIARPEHHDFVLRYVQRHYAQIAFERYSGADILEEWIYSVRSEREYSEISSWVKANLKDQDLEKATSALEWLDRFLASWFRLHYRHTAAYLYKITKTSPPPEPATTPTTPTDATSSTEASITAKAGASLASAPAALTTLGAVLASSLAFQ